MSNWKTNRKTIPSPEKIMCAPQNNSMVLSYTLKACMKYIMVTLACTAGMFVCAYPIMKLCSSINTMLFLVIAVILYYVAFHVVDRPFKYIYTVRDRLYRERFWYRTGFNGTYGFWAVVCALITCLCIMGIINNGFHETEETTHIPYGHFVLILWLFFLSLVFLYTYWTFRGWKKRFPRSTVKI